ncbi:MAG: glycine cleavage system aminomethyltransferase GcvT [Sandaracinaceae bacterium]
MTTETLRRTPLYDAHKALGGRIVPFAGWELPVQYAGLLKEHAAVRNAAGLFDVSHMGELKIEGPAAEEFIDGLVTGDLTTLPDGKALYTVACNARGTILDDLIVYRRGREKFLIVMNASNRDKIAAHFGAHAAPFVARGALTFADISDETALLALQGPLAVEVMRHAQADAAITSLGSFCLVEGIVSGVRVIAARTGYTAEDGFELFVHPEDATRLWNGLLAAGKPLGIEPCGLGARDTLRLEGRLSLYGNEIDETTNPLEAGLGWVTKLDKPRDFLGRAALCAIRDAGLTRKLVGFEMVGRGIGRHGYPIHAWTGADTPSGPPIGHVTSGSPAPTLDKNIGLGYVPVAHAEIGTKLGIEIRGKVIEAVVVKTPFYKRRK